MAHLVSSDRERLLMIADALSMEPAWLQYKPLKHPATEVRIAAWHWDLRGRSLESALRAAGSIVPAGLVLSP